jgi:hypothetical protein
MGAKLISDTDVPMTPRQIVEAATAAQARVTAAEAQREWDQEAADQLDQLRVEYEELTGGLLWIQ